MHPQYSRTWGLEGPETIDHRDADHESLLDRGSIVNLTRKPPGEINPARPSNTENLTEFKQFSYIQCC